MSAEKSYLLEWFSSLRRRPEIWFQIWNPPNTGPSELGAGGDEQRFLCWPLLHPVYGRNPPATGGSIASGIFLLFPQGKAREMYRVGLNQNLIWWRRSPAQIALNRSSARGHKKSLSGDSCASDRSWFSCCTAVMLCNGTDKTREPSSQVPLGEHGVPCHLPAGTKASLLKLVLRL